MCSEGFEPGITLSAVAPFLSGNRTGLVTAAKRDVKTGLFVLELTLESAPAPQRPTRAKVSKPSAAAQAAFCRYAQQLADKLSLARKKPYRLAAFGKAGGQEGYVAATAAAVFLLLAEKKQVDALAILPRLTRAR